MKRLLLCAISILGLASMAMAYKPTWLSSNTATADTTAILCGTFVTTLSTTVLHGVIHEVVVSSAVTSGLGNITLYNSTFTASSQNIGPIYTGATGVYPYDIEFPNGLIYTKTGTNQVQIIYSCF